MDNTARRSQPEEVDAAMRAEVLRGLQQSPRWLPSKYFYDARGARLFEQICTLDAYYPTRCELEILDTHLAAIAAQLGPHCDVIEPGSGEGIKTLRLLQALDRPQSYQPIDVAGDQLEAAAGRLRQRFPALTIRPVHGDFTQPLRLSAEATRRVFYFPGSTIGNFLPESAQALLQSWRHAAGPSGQLLIGVDLRKDPALLEAAYNDPEGLTADFNRNILRHVNRRLGSDFELTDWAHAAPYDADTGQIQMWLRARRDVQVRFPGGPILEFAAGEGIRTEYSCKYELTEFAALCARAGWVRPRVWTDARGWFSLQLYSAA